MTRGYVPQRNENGNEDWSIMRVDLDYEVPDHVLDDAPSQRGGTPRRYAQYRGVEGRDVVDFLLDNGVSVGAHDVSTADWIVRDLDPATVLTLLSWVRRASAARPTWRSDIPRSARTGAPPLHSPTGHHNLRLGQIGGDKRAAGRLTRLVPPQVRGAQAG